MPIYGQQNGLWADALDPIVRYRFDLAFGRRPSMIPYLFNVQGSVRAYEQISGVGAVGIDAWDTWRVAGHVGEADFDQGYKTTYTHVEYPMDIRVMRSLIDDANFPQVFRLIERVGDSAALKREHDAASIFNNAFTDTAPYAGADGVGLVSTAHPFGPQKTGATQSNEGTYALTLDNVATVREAMMAFTDDNGNPMGITPNAVIVPPGMGDEARVIFNSTLNPTTANNALNPRTGEAWQIFEWAYITDSTYWFMVDTNLMRQSLDWFNRVPLTINPIVEDKTMSAGWRAYMRYALGWSDWRWIFGNNA